MNKNRLSYKNKLVDDIKQIGLTLERDLSSIIKLKNSKFDIVFIENSVNKINEKIVEKNNRKKDLERELIDLESGVLDDKIQDEYKKNKIAITIKNDEIQKKKNIIAVQKADDVERTKIQQQHSREINNSIKQGIRDVKYYERKFFSCIESLPPYIDRNLCEMQNNKGYLWKGIIFFGKLPVNSKESESESQELMVFDKQNKDLLIIHEWTKNEYSVYKKIGKNPKTVISKKARVNKFSDNLPIFEKLIRVDDVKSKSDVKSMFSRPREQGNENVIVNHKVESLRGRGGYRGRGGNRGRGGVVNVSREDSLKKLNEGQANRGRGGLVNVSREDSLKKLNEGQANRGRGGLVNVSREDSVKKLNEGQANRGRGGLVNVSREDSVKKLNEGQANRGRGGLVNVSREDSVKKLNEGQANRGRGRGRGRGGKEPHNITLSNTKPI